jgi:hypothetical protein
MVPIPHAESYEGLNTALLAGCTRVTMVRGYEPER